jgi:hypothetical protein
MLLLVVISSVVVGRFVWSDLEGTPIPVPWNTLSHALWGAVLPRAEDTAHCALCLACAIDNRCYGRIKLLFRALAV